MPAALVPGLRSARIRRAARAHRARGPAGGLSDPAHIGAWSRNGASYAGLLRAINKASTRREIDSMLIDGIQNRGTQTVHESTDAIVQMATIGPDGPTATFVSRTGRVPW